MWTEKMTEIFCAQLKILISRIPILDRGVRFLVQNSEKVNRESFSVTKKIH
jgi:hypothetical protein